jgi:hypothetical protein
MTEALAPVVRPIGVTTPFTSTGMPSQAVAAGDVPGRIELDPALEPGLADPAASAT